jgi:hypothetical protein
VSETNHLSGVTSTYYSNGRLERKFLQTADADGNIQYRYHNEAFYNVGTASEYGRISHLYKTNGTKLYYAAYYAGTDKPKTVEEYSSSWQLVNTYAYYSNGRLERKFLQTADADGNIQYRYHNEAFYNVGTASEYGRISHLYKTNGTKLYYAAYWTGTDKPKTVEEYDSGWNLIHTYNYDQDGNPLSNYTELASRLDVEGGIKAYGTDSSGNVILTSSMAGEPKNPLK